MSDPENHANTPAGAGDSPLDASAPGQSDLAPANILGAETEATKIHPQEEAAAPAQRRSRTKLLVGVTAVAVIAAAAWGGRTWWSHRETSGALAELHKQGAFITHQGSQVRVAAVNGTFQDEDFALVTRISCPLQLTLTANSEITDEGLARLNGMTNITGLDIATTNVTDVGLAHLATLSSLERLDISNNRRITDEGMKHIGQCVRLKELTMPATSISDAGIDPLFNLSQLEFLVIGQTKVSRAGAKKIRDAIGPEQLHVLGAASR